MKEGFKLTIKGTVTRIFVEKDSGFKIVVVTVRDKLDKCRYRTCCKYLSSVRLYDIFPHMA